MIRICLEGFPVDLVGLAIQPADGPMIPLLGDPPAPTRVLERVFLDSCELMPKTASIAHYTERVALTQACQQNSARRIIQHFPIAPGSPGNCAQQGRFLPFPENVVAV